MVVSCFRLEVRALAATAIPGLLLFPEVRGRYRAPWRVWEGEAFIPSATLMAGAGPHQVEGYPGPLGSWRIHCSGAYAGCGTTRLGW